MKILIYNWRDIKHSWAGGGELYIFEQAKRWVTMGHEVTIFCGDDYNNKLPDEETIDNIRLYRKGNRFTVYLWGCWYYFTKFRGKFEILIDVINGIPFFTPLYSGLPKAAFVYHVHGKQFFYEVPFPLNFVGYLIERYLFPIVYRHIHIVAISKTTKRNLQKIGLNKKNISLLYCGVNGSTRTTKHTAKFSKPTILYLGRVKKYKRVDLLVNIFSKIVERVPRANLIIAGWGSEASNIADLIMRNPLRRKIKLMGPINNSEKQTLLSKSWIFVNPSIGEGWSISVIEANLYGTPAVSFNVPGLAESIQHGNTGLLAKDTNDLVNKICMILTKRSLRERLSKNAGLWAKNFTWDRAAKRGIQILKRIQLN